MTLRFRNVLAVLLLGLPIAAFWSIWSRLAVNVPKWDDHALKAFLLNLSKETTPSGQLYQFWRQHNEHRIVLDRVLTFADVHLFGSLDYTRLMFVGNMALVGLLVVFALVVHRSGRWWGWVVPVAYLLFNLGEWENMFWGMTTLSNFGVMLWVVVSIYLLGFTKSLPAPLLAALMATLTNGIGILIWPLGAVLLALQNRWRSLIIWLIAAVLLIGAYFLNYEAPANNPPTVPTLVDQLAGFLAFLGSAAEVLPFGVVFSNCVGLGVLLVGTTAWLGVGLLRRWRDRTNWLPSDFFFVGVTGFLLGTALVVARSRAGYGLETLITSRYKIYSFTLMSLLYVYAIMRQSRLSQNAGSPQRAEFRLAAIGLVAGMGLVWLSYPAYRGESEHLRRWLVASQFNWTYTQNRPVSTIDPITARTLANAHAFYDACLPALFGPATGPLLPIDSLFRQGNDWIIQNRTVPIPVAAMPDAGLYLRLQSARRTYLFAARPGPVSGFRSKLSMLPVRGVGATAYVTPGTVDTGQYSLSWLVVNDTGACQLRPTDRTLTIASDGRPAAKTNW